jgi:hypothetical protein
MGQCELITSQTHSGSDKKRRLYSVLLTKHSRLTHDTCMGDASSSLYLMVPAATNGAPLQLASYHAIYTG